MPRGGLRGGPSPGGAAGAGPEPAEEEERCPGGGSRPGGGDGVKMDDGIEKMSWEEARP